MSEDVKVISFGCRLNSYESDVLEAKARAAGLKDAIIVNTCAVTTEAERQARQTIRKLARENPGAKLFVTGCASQIRPDAYAKLPGVAGVVANKEKLELEKYGVPVVSCADEQFFAKDFQKKPRVYLEIQNGCDYGCTFCTIPAGRGKSRSIAPEMIASRLRGLVAQGINEVVFTGVDITSYGKDIPGMPSLGQMARQVLQAVPELPRLRFSSLDPAAIDEDFWQLFAEEPRVMPHLHLSVQAGDNMILKRMKRRHDRDLVIAIGDRARSLREGAALGADMIAGFPTETEDMFQNSLNLIDEAGLNWLHVFPFSARPDTPAARMPQVDSRIRTERAARLRTRGVESMRRLLATMEGRHEEVLVESNALGMALGRTGNYAEVNFPSDLPAGSLASIRIEKFYGVRLLGAEETASRVAA
jgi:threonylcarbamoyladenosine tRNA methylthiotransferase MtaB